MWNLSSLLQTGPAPAKNRRYGQVKLIVHDRRGQKFFIIASCVALLHYSMLTLS